MALTLDNCPAWPGHVAGLIFMLIALALLLCVVAELRLQRSRREAGESQSWGAYCGATAVRALAVRLPWVVVILEALQLWAAGVSLTLAEGDRQRDGIFAVTAMLIDGPTLLLGCLAPQTDALRRPGSLLALALPCAVFAVLFVLRALGEAVPLCWTACRERTFLPQVSAEKFKFLRLVLPDAVGAHAVLFFAFRYTFARGVLRGMQCAANDELEAGCGEGTSLVVGLALALWHLLGSTSLLAWALAPPAGQERVRGILAEVLPCGHWVQVQLFVGLLEITCLELGISLAQEAHHLGFLLCEGLLLAEVLMILRPRWLLRSSLLEGYVAFRAALLASFHLLARAPEEHRLLAAELQGLAVVLAIASIPVRNLLLWSKGAFCCRAATQTKPSDWPLGNSFGGSPRKWSHVVRCAVEMPKMAIQIMLAERIGVKAFDITLTQDERMCLAVASKLVKGRLSHTLPQSAPARAITEVSKQWALSVGNSNSEDTASSRSGPSSNSNSGPREADSTPWSSVNRVEDFSGQASDSTSRFTQNSSLGSSRKQRHHTKLQQPGSGVPPHLMRRKSRSAEDVLRMRGPLSQRGTGPLWQTICKTGSDGFKPAVFDASQPTTSQEPSSSGTDGRGPDPLTSSAPVSSLQHRGRERIQGAGRQKTTARQNSFGSSVPEASAPLTASLQTSSFSTAQYTSFSSAASGRKPNQNDNWEVGSTTSSMKAHLVKCNIWDTTLGKISGAPDAEASRREWVASQVASSQMLLKRFDAGGDVSGGHAWRERGCAQEAASIPGQSTSQDTLPSMVGASTSLDSLPPAPSDEPARLEQEQVSAEDARSKSMSWPSSLPVLSDEDNSPHKACSSQSSQPDAASPGSPRSPMRRRFEVQKLKSATQDTLEQRTDTINSLDEHALGASSSPPSSDDEAKASKLSPYSAEVGAGSVANAPRQDVAMASIAKDASAALAPAEDAVGSSLMNSSLEATRFCGGEDTSCGATELDPIGAALNARRSGAGHCSFDEGLGSCKDIGLKKAEPIVDRWEQWRRRKLERKDRKVAGDFKATARIGHRSSCPADFRDSSSFTNTLQQRRSRRTDTGCYQSWHGSESPSACSSGMNYSCTSRNSHRSQDTMFQLAQHFSQRTKPQRDEDKEAGQHSWQTGSSSSELRTWC